MTRTQLNNWKRTDAKQLGMANENLAEEGKRLEVALRYVTQINTELLDQMADYERKMEDFEEIVEENHSLQLLMVPNGQSIEKMNEALRKDYARQKRDLRHKASELDRLQKERLFSEYNEKMVR